ncbi:aconitate hydratase AcnA [Rheinheimera nanhaiensis]|uniref:Aconitate hydratase n=1 Tax=Rheinheimera nanhaiensis E407-8 TaxID=562729 RepID=I1DZG8_9GAMM|nr:aconitate hydratase AcnA [Rheinheimera nanhaiensis]GAB59446.1 aconitate hydratase 1 [Rheinheimera nanhaiensis E407-8]
MTSANPYTDTLSVAQQQYRIYSLSKAAERFGDISRLPFSLKVLLENLLRHLDGDSVTDADIQALVDWQKTGSSEREIAFRPARVLMQDFTGVPAVVDLAAMRAAVAALGEDPDKVNPLSPVDLVIDHSVMVDRYASADAFSENVNIEMQRNYERYAFLRWGAKAFANFRVVPPGTGICHQVNLEYLGQTVWAEHTEDCQLAYPDTLVGTDSHTTMINALGILGWGVGGIEAEAAMLGQPVSMTIPQVVGVELTGRLAAGITATDLVLTVTQLLRKHGVVGKFVEFFGAGLAQLSLADRATIANMAPEYGATCGFFPVDQITLDYLKLTGRDGAVISRVKAYCQAQGLWREDSDEPGFTDKLHLDLATVEASLAGPKRPQDKVTLTQLKQHCDDTKPLDSKTQAREAELVSEGGGQSKAATTDNSFDLNGSRIKLPEHAVVIAAITSCTNTSNPSVLMAAGLLAKNALAKGLQAKPWVKCSLAPGSKVVSRYLQQAGLMSALEQVGFYLVGYGCTTCIGNSGPLAKPIAEAINKGDLNVSAVLSGNRNFEGRIHPLVKSNWLASPPLVVAFALAGRMNIDLSAEPIGQDAQGNDVYLKDIWPDNDRVAAAVATVQSSMFSAEYDKVFDGDASWQAIEVAKAKTYSWPDSSYIRQPDFFRGLSRKPKPVRDIVNARVLAILGDSVTTDHISPAGNIKQSSPAGEYLQQLGIAPEDFNSYGSRRGNHEVMVRGTFANVRIRNEMLPGSEGGVTRHYPSGDTLPIFAAAMRYQQQELPLIVIAGKEYGTGSSRDWAAKGTLMLGVRAVLAESFERIHRSNLIGMGVLPLQFLPGTDRKTLKLTGEESFTLRGLSELTAKQKLQLLIRYADGGKQEIDVHCRIDTATELAYYQHGGILHYVLRRMIGAA